MSCPTCDHAMQSVGGEVFWCPRCGSLRYEEPGGMVIDHVSELVERVRETVDLVNDKDYTSSALDTLIVTGVVESCYLPYDRPTIINED